MRIRHHRCPALGHASRSGDLEPRAWSIIKVVFGSYDHYLHMLDADTGQVAWRYDLGGACVSTPCIVDGYIYIGNATGRCSASVREPGACGMRGACESFTP